MKNCRGSWSLQFDTSGDSDHQFIASKQNRHKMKMYFIYNDNLSCHYYFTKVSPMGLQYFSSIDRYVQCSAPLGTLQRYTSRKSKISLRGKSNPRNELMTNTTHQNFSKELVTKSVLWQFRWANRRPRGGRPPPRDGPWCGGPSSGGSSTRMHPRATPHMRPRRTPRTPELGPGFGSGRGCGRCRTRSTMAQMGSMVDRLIRLLELSQCSWLNKFAKTSVSNKK